MSQFGTLLREYRQSCVDPISSRLLSQQYLGELLGNELGGYSFSGAAVSDWERGKSKIHADDRRTLVALIGVLYKLGGIKTISEANGLLEAGNYRALNFDEIKSVFPEESIDTEVSIVNRPIRVFICHSSNDKPVVRELYRKLRSEEWIQPWLDEEDIYPGEDWEIAIQKAVEESDAVLVCLSSNSITKKGYIQKELRFALDIALQLPEGIIFIIPLRLEECEPPRSLQTWQYANYFPESERGHAFERLLISLKKRWADLPGSTTK